MQCPACNQEVSPQAAFCNHCGTPLAAVPPQPPQPPADFPPSYAAAPTPPPSDFPPSYAAAANPPPAAPTAYPPAAASSGLSDNSAAALAYVTIIPAILFLILEPYNKIRLVRFHSMQCIGLFVVAVVLHFAITIFGSVLHIIPFLGVIFTLLLHVALSIGIFIAWLMCIMKASKGEYFKLPVIGDFAAKQANT